MVNRVILTAIMFSLIAGQALAGNYRQARDEPWIMVDTTRQTLMVMVGDHIEKKFVDISVGRGGTADLHFRGDGSTPKGSFRIAWVNQRSKFHLFFGLDYPNIDHAELAYESAKIDFETFYTISHAVMRGQTPPQDTPLGGFIGIHGLGHKDPRMHKMLNWTEGCIALTDEQIDQLAHWIDVGTRVVIF